MPFQTVQFCSVKGCSNTTQTVDGHGVGLNFFTLPTEEPERELWVKFLNRPNNEMNDQVRVCSAHFPEGEPTQLYPAPCLSGPSHQGNSQLLEPVKTHPSVRVKGTEVSFTPFNCTDPTCPNKALHMHCPFCVRTESYQDPVILKMHYRVKHVDKGIDFAGLKILRCCDRCEIVGAIKGEKIFKGAHWHCYKCRNGFNRRDEAIKHYKTHFRNPETTFQIQISQIEDESARQEQSAASSALANGIMVRSCTPSSQKTAGEVQVPVAANETVGPSEPQTIMIIQEAGMDANNSTLENSYTVIPTDQYSDDNSVVEEVLGDLPDAQHHADDQLKRLNPEASVSHLQSHNALLKAEVAELKSKLMTQSKELERSRKREQELVQQLSIPLEEGIQELLKDMEKKHMELLHQQLGAIRRSYLSQLSKQNQTITIPSAALQNAVLGAESGSISITIQRNGVAGDGLEDSHSTTLEVEQFSQPEHVDNQVLEAGEGSVLHLMPVSQRQQQLQVTAGEPFSVPSVTTVAQPIVSTDTSTYETGLQSVSLVSPSYGFATQTILVEGTDHLQDTAESECTPAKRSRTNSS